MRLRRIPVFSDPDVITLVGDRFITCHIDIAQRVDGNAMTKIVTTELEASDEADDPDDCRSWQGAAPLYYEATQKVDGGEMKYKYKIDLIWDPDDKICIAQVPELDGCMSHGKTEFEALRNVEKAIAGWIKTAKEFKMKIPEPIPQRKFSGSFNVRVPKEVHRNLALKAAEEHISLNHLISQLLAKAV